MSEDAPQYGKFKETRLADHDPREIASEFADALLDLTGQVYEVEITAIDRRPDDQADIRLWVRRVDDCEIPEAEKWPAPIAPREFSPKQTCSDSCA